MISGVILDQNSKPVPQTLKSREDWNFGRQRLYLAHGFEHRQELRCLAQRFLIVKSRPRHGGMRGASISNARVRAWSPFLNSSPRDRRCVLVAPGTSKRSCAVRAGLIRKMVCQGVPVYAQVCQDMPSSTKALWLPSGPRAVRASPLAIALHHSGVRLQAPCPSQNLNPFR